jgi:V-type H+-transporting ATPase 16kDa proteolipid subunit
MGAAYGTAKSGIGIGGVGTFRPDLIMKVCALAMLASLQGPFQPS